MSDAYDNVVGGGLKLKGGIKKKKKRKEEAPTDAESLARRTEVMAAQLEEAGPSGGDSVSSALWSGLTESERRRKETMLKRDIERAEKGKAKSHREKVKDFNNYLASMTEHYDLPKVSKGN